jgi:hypothetical protein
MPSPKVPSARVLANRANRIQMHRESLSALNLGIADGMLEMGNRILADAAAHARLDVHPAEAAARRAERGVSQMADTGGVQVWALGKRAGGIWEKKPRGARIRQDEVEMIVGFGSPLAHLKEEGTIKEPARPFLLPAFNRGLPDASKFVVPAMGKRIRETP